MENEAMSLYELNSLVRRGLHACLPDEYWIQAELSDVRSNYSGHCYMEFVQKDPKSNALIAKARGVIWSNVFMRLRPYFEHETGQAFVSGIKVMVKVTVDFHELYGFSLTVVDIDPAYTSQTCSYCGERGERKKQEEFVCTNPQCKRRGEKINADFNAARNIAMSKKIVER